MVILILKILRIWLSLYLLNKYNFASNGVFKHNHKNK